MAEKQKVIGYIRVSTDHQVDEGVSLEAQRMKIIGYCDIYDLELVRIDMDAGISAKEMTNRPALQRALASIKGGEADALIVTKIDRLSRSIMDMGTLVKDYFKDGDGLISIAEQINTGTATGRMFLNMITMFSQYERELIGERTQTALQHLKSQGVQLGPTPLGWARGEGEGEGRREIVKDPEGQATMSRILELREQGTSMNKIANILHKEGVPTSRGGRWRAQTVSLILKRCLTANNKQSMINV